MDLYPLEIVKTILENHGIHVIEEFGDGQILWGVPPINSPYKGPSFIGDTYNSRCNLPTIQAIVNKLDKAGEMNQIEQELKQACTVQ